MTKIAIKYQKSKSTLNAVFKRETKGTLGDQSGVSSTKRHLSFADYGSMNDFSSKRNYRHLLLK